MKIIIKNTMQFCLQLIEKRNSLLIICKKNSHNFIIIKTKELDKYSKDKFHSQFS